MRPFTTSRGGRRANVTLIVVAFLGLFFILGLTFAFYSIAEADQAKVFRDSGNAAGASGPDGGPPDADAIFNKALADIIFGPQQDYPGAFNPLRGHDLARLIYGWDSNPVNPLVPTQPYSGIGRVTFDQMHPNLVQPTNPLGLPQAVAQNMVNFAWSRFVPGLGGMMFDVDNNRMRNPKLNLPAFDPTTYRYYAKNANYTYPDANNMFLAVVDPKSGRVLIPSYHRPWLIQQNPPVPAEQITGTLPPDNRNPANNPPTGLPPDPYSQFNPINLTNPNPWTNPYGGLAMLTPRPVDHQWPPQSGNSLFPYPTLNLQTTGPNAGQPDGTYGHVVNLEGGDGRYDSMWIDIDLPVRRFKGKNYKPLIAPLIVDLDGRVNLNTAGNFHMIPQQPALPEPPRWAHWSNHGFPWEVNLAKVMPNRNPSTGQPVVWPDGNPDVTEAAEISRAPFVPNPQAPHKRFGLNGVPNRQWQCYQNEPMIPNMPPPGSGAAFYSQVDFDGRFKTFSSAPPPFPRYHDLFSGRDTNVIWGSPFIGPATMPPTAVAPGPSVDSRYGNGMFIPPNNYEERIDHPAMYNPYLLRPRSMASKQPDRQFGVEELRYLNAQYNHASLYGSELAAMTPNSLGITNFPAGMLNSRWATTPYSADLDLPGSSPWRSAPAADYAMLTGQQFNGVYPVGQTTQALVPSAAPNPAPIPGPPGADHDAGYRALLTQLGPVDINRKLADYRQYLNQPYGVTNYSGANAAQALRDRQALARDIFARLLFATTGTQPGALASSPNTDANRYLAQLAVNIVDYLDEDDYMTAFNWNPAMAAAPGDVNGEAVATAGDGWVFGFERPRLVINEVYGRLENDPMDTEITAPADGLPNATTNFIAKWWIELHNPLTPANANELLALSDNGAAMLRHPTTQQSIYQIVFAKKTATQSRLTAPPAAGAPVAAPPNNNVLGAVQTQTDELVKLRFGAGGMGVQQTHDRVGPNLRDANGQGYSSPQPANAGSPAPAFFLVASENEPPDDTPMGQMIANWSDTNLKYNVPLFPIRMGVATAVGSEDERAPRIMLRRLANPCEPPGEMNPYVTVDYFRFDKRMMNDAVEWGTNNNEPPNPPGMGMKPGQFMQKINWNAHFSYGKRQPFEAPDFAEDTGDLTPYKANPNPPPAVQEQIRNTWSRHNGQGTDWTTAGATLEQPFQPLIHQDRVALNPVELLHVVGVKPYEFTQYFKKPVMPAQPQMPQRWAYTANWLDEGLQPTQSTFLWRALDFLRVSPPMDGLAIGGRVPGRININTLFAAEILAAVMDPHIPPQPPVPPPSPPTDYRFSGNRTTLPPDPSMWPTWMNLFLGVQGRTPNGQIDGNNRPFLGTAAPGNSEVGGVPPAPVLGRDKTIFKLPGGQVGLWNGQALEDYGPAQAGSLEKFEMVSKSFNNFTTRSNAFAVYLTIGYFEVMNDGPYTEANRPVLGKEIGSDEGTLVRHKFFAVVDRTNLAIEDPQPSQPIKQGPMPVYLDYHPALPKYVPDPMNPSNLIAVNDPDLSAPPTPMPTPAPPPWVAAEVAPAPVPLQTPGIMVRIPAISQVPFNPPPAPPPTPTISVSGYYDGVLWTLVTGSLIELDINGQKETVIVQLPPNSFNPLTGTAEIIIRPFANPTIAKPAFDRNHYRGALMRILGPDPNVQNPSTGLPMGSTPGNPGPQPAFQYSSPRYAPVVKYAERMR